MVGTQSARTDPDLRAPMFSSKIEEISLRQDHPDDPNDVNIDHGHLFLGRQILIIHHL